MDKFHFGDDLTFKKWALGIAFISLVLYLINSFYAEGVLRRGSNYILLGTKEDEVRAERVAREYQEEFDRIQQGMRSIAEDIKNGALSIDKEHERMQKEFEADKKRIAVWNKSFDESTKEMNEVFMKAVHEADERHKRVQQAFVVNMGKAERAKEEAELKRLLVIYKPSIECEKRVYGHSTFQLDDPYWYREKGIEYKFEQCKDLRRKKSP